MCTQAVLAQNETRDRREQSVEAEKEEGPSQLTKNQAGRPLVSKCWAQGENLGGEQKVPGQKVRGGGVMEVPRRQTLPSRYSEIYAASLQHTDHWCPKERRPPECCEHDRAKGRRPLPP